MAGILGLVVGSVIVVDYVGLAVLVKEESGVDALHFGEHDGVAPTLGWILCLYKEVACSDIGGDHVVGLVGGIVGDVGRKDAAAHVLLLEIFKLRGAVEHIACLFPVDEVAAVKQGHPG